MENSPLQGRSNPSLHRQDKVVPPRVPAKKLRQQVYSSPGQLPSRNSPGGSFTATIRIAKEGE
jgi:hypothetical protein